MVWTITDIVNVSPRIGEFCGQVRVHGADIVLSVERTRHSGNDEHKQARVVERSDRRFGAFDQAKPFDLANISVVIVEDSVAVEKGRRPPPALGDFAVRPREIRREPNINEVAVKSDAEQPPRLCESREDIALERTSRLEDVNERGLS